MNRMLQTVRLDKAAGVRCVRAVIGRSCHVTRVANSIRSLSLSHPEHMSDNHAWMNENRREKQEIRKIRKHGHLHRMKNMIVAKVIN